MLIAAIVVVALAITPRPALAALPDLTMSAVTAPLYGSPGHAIAITNTVRNAGTVSAAAFVVRFYMSASSSTPGTGRLVGTRSVAGLAPGASATATTVVTVPADLAFGLYYVSARADAGGAVAESNETNNGRTAGARINLTTYRPNLSMASLSAPVSAGTGTTISVPNTVTNLGPAPAGAFRIRFYMSPTSATPGAGTAIGLRNLGSLGAGASSAAITTLTIPSGFAAGNYYLSAVADADRALIETTRANNGRTAAQRVAVAVRPDLAVTDLSIPEVVVAGAAVPVTTTVSNQGRGGAGASSVKVYLFTSATFVPGTATLLGTATVPSLAGGAVSSATTTMTVPAHLPSGVYFRAAVADAGAAVAESDETDNVLVSAGAVRVLPAGGGSGRYRIAGRGLYTQFEERGWASGFWSGDAVKRFFTVDDLGHDVSDEIALQLDTMRGMGINAIAFELRAADADGNFSFPRCNIHPVLGLNWPQPTPTELSNLVALFDLVRSKGLRVYLRLVNTHMDLAEWPNSKTWLRAVLNTLKGHPALDLVLFEGDTRHVDTTGDGIADSCGTPAEPPLWLGPRSVPVQYVKSAIAYAMSLGYPPRKLSAEAIIGDFFVENHPPAGPDATDGHLWSPVPTLKQVFDELGIPNAQRTYAVSFYQHRKCRNPGGLPCTEAAPHDWAEQTLRALATSIGTGNGARVVAVEMGAMTPVEAAWPTERALESLVTLMEKYGVEGGAFWRWVSDDNTEDLDSTLAEPVKRRGVAFTYTKVQKEVLDMGGLHLVAIPNGSFEIDANANNVPDGWAIIGAGTGVRYLLAAEPGQPEVPSRGSYALRLVTGGGANDSITARSGAIAAAPSTEYTTTANLRFRWTGDPSPSASPEARPQVSVRFRYFTGAGTPSTIRAFDVFRFFQKNATTGFDTFPLRYVTPADAASLRIEIEAARHGLPTPITLDVDNVR